MYTLLTTTDSCSVFLSIQLKHRVYKLHMQSMGMLTGITISALFGIYWYYTYGVVL